MAQEETRERRPPLKSLSRSNSIADGLSYVSEKVAVSAMRFQSTLTNLAHKRIEQDDWPNYRTKLLRLIQSDNFETSVGLLIIINFVLFVYETDMTVGPTPPARPDWLLTANITLFAIYATETGLRLVAMRSFFFMGIVNWNTFDLFLVLSDCFLMVLTLLDANPAQTEIIRALRIFRLLRIGKALRSWRALRELYVMLHALIGTLKAMFWASIMLVLVLTLFSCMAVELIHPLVLKMTADGHFDGCDRCPHAFSSVWNSQVTFFQTLVAGDSWGQTAIPIIEKYPLTAPFFLGVLVLIHVGILNLILAAILDQATRISEDDMQLQAMSKQESFLRSRHALLNICEELDTDKNGNITESEILRGYETMPEFAYQLKFLDLTKDDLGVLFKVLDADGSGAVEYEELIEQLFKLQNQDVSVSLGFLHNYAQQICKTVTSHSKDFEMQKQTQAEILSLVKSSMPAVPEAISQAGAAQALPFQGAMSEQSSADLQFMQQSLDSALAIRFQALEESISAMLRIQEIRFEAFESNFAETGITATPWSSNISKEGKLRGPIEDNSCLSSSGKLASPSSCNQLRSDPMSLSELARKPEYSGHVQTSRV